MEERNKKQELTPKTTHSTRSDIANHFDESALISNTEGIHYSPDRRFYFKSGFYRQTDPNRNWMVSTMNTSLRLVPNLHLNRSVVPSQSQSTLLSL